MLTDINLFLSMIGAVCVAALFVVVRRGDTYHGVKQHPARVRGRIHARIGSTVLLFYALLGITSAIGAWMPGSQDWISIIAVGWRVGIGILLLSWVAWEVDARISPKHPKIHSAIDYVLTFGHRAGATHN